MKLVAILLGVVLTGCASQAHAPIITGPAIPEAVVCQINPRIDVICARLGRLPDAPVKMYCIQRRGPSFEVYIPEGNI